MGNLVFEFAVRAFLIAMVTAAVLRLLRIRTASARHRAWTGVVVVMLLLPIWLAWGPRAAVHVLPALESSSPVSVSSPGRPEFHPASPIGAAASNPSRPEASKPAWRFPSLLAGIYLLGAIVLLARLFLGTARAHVLMRRAKLQDGQLSSSWCVSPITVGWLHPVSILPEHWTQWSASQLRAVLIHEREHARRRDPLVQWLALFNRAVFWFHPLAWWLERQLSLLAEEACDAAVLSDGHDPRDYSEYLMDLANSVMQVGRRVHVTGMSLPGSYLPRRIPRLFDGTATRRISRVRLVCAFAVCAISSAAFGAVSLERIQRRSEMVSTVTGASEVKPVHVELTPRKATSTAPVSVAALAQNPAPAPLAGAVSTPSIQIESRFVVADRSLVQEVLRRAGIESGTRPATNSNTNTTNTDGNRLLVVAVGGVAALDEIIAAAEANGTARVLGRPQIRTQNNMEATVSQGTQIPVQVNTNGTTSVDFLNVGLKMSVLPQIRDSGTILMKMNLELSQLENTRSVNGTTSGVTQRVITTVVLMEDGTTSMVGGLVVDAGVPGSRPVPGLGAIPAIGGLFAGG
ncbi:MAG TPA: M56 family metallopeptidase, partial [Terriglobia bacterium]|nr:M56 family metallopeptidase [Terriglobia bacterium]